MEKPSTDPLDNNPKIEKPSDTWPNFANNFLYKFFEGRSFSIWLLVSGVLIILYGRYAYFDGSWMGILLKNVSFILLCLLIILTLIKNLIVLKTWNIGDRIRSRFQLTSTYNYPSWVVEVLGSESTKLDLPLKIINFKKIYSRVKIIDPGDGRWRAGFVFNSLDGRREYIFHAYQNTGQSTFWARIVERVPGVKEEPGDINKQIGVRIPRDFIFWTEIEDKKLAFYIDNILIGKYEVPFKKISNIQLAAWSDAKPIKVLFEDIEVKA